MDVNHLQTVALRLKTLSGLAASAADAPEMMNLSELACLLVTLGCPAEKSLAMAGQLDKRARQLASQKGKTYQEAMTHLLKLMKQGWAAKTKGL